MATSRPRRREPSDTLQRIKRGLAGYVSYLAACGMNEAFSEYVLYEPILRILRARKYVVKCEYICPGVTQPKVGDKKRVDFYATWKSKAETVELAIEVKWVRNKKSDISKDIEKLDGFLSANSEIKPILCIFGRRSHLEELDLGSHFAEHGEAIFADFARTRFGCRMFELARKVNRKRRAAKR